MTVYEGSFEGELTWALRRLALWGEIDQSDNGDPHVAYEAKCHAKTVLEQLTVEIE